MLTHLIEQTKKKSFKLDSLGHFLGLILNGGDTVKLSTAKLEYKRRKKKKTANIMKLSSRGQLQTGFS